MIVAVDTGGTKTLVALFGDDGGLIQSEKFPTPQDTDTYLSHVIETIDHLTEAKTISAICVALPGTVVNGVAVRCGNLKWHDFDVVAPLNARYNVPTYVENDANLAGLAETLLIVPLPELSLYVTVSTGIGTGIISNGRINRSLSRSEGGEMPLEYDGAMRTWESFASGASIYKAYGKFGKDIHDNGTWKQIADRISRGLLVSIPLLQPNVVILGGSMGTHFEKYAEQLQLLLQEHLPVELPMPEIRQAQRPEEAVVYGCYHYAIDQTAD